MFWLFGDKTESKRPKAESGSVPYLSVGWPIAALVSLIAIAGFSVLNGIAKDQDLAHEQNTQFAVSQALEVETQTNWTMAKEFAFWNEAFDRITVKDDRAWSEENMYSIHVTAMAVYRPHVGLISLHVHPSAEDLKPEIERQLPNLSLTQEVNTEAHSNSPQRDSGEVDWFTIGGRLAAVAVIPLRRETEPNTTSGQNQQPKDLVVSITLVDTAKLKGIGNIAESARLTAITSDPTVKANKARSQTIIRNNAGDALAKISWTAEKPGRDAFAQRVVPITLFLLFFSVLTVAVVRALAQRQSTLRSAFDAAEQSNKTKSSFLAVVSHELRTPLNTILGYAALIEESALEGDSAAVSADARKITNSANHLLALVNDILDHSKIEAGKMDLAPVHTPLEPLLLSVTASLETEIAKSPCDFIVSIDPMIGDADIDPMRIKQCLINLLSNALKFTLNGSVTLSARALRKNGVPCFQISVKDTGIGMDEETLAKVFTPFVQAHPAIASGFGGTGLGLSITRSLVQAMGGTLSVESGLGVGSNFTITIPRHMI